MNAFRDAPITTARWPQLIAARQELEVVLERFREADPGIDENLLAIDSARRPRRRELSQLARHVVHDVVVIRQLLHRPRLAAHVHQDDRHAAAAASVAHGRDRPQRADVVDDVGARVERRLRDLRLRGIDRDRDVATGGGSAR